jgi:hypothetical protein
MLSFRPNELIGTLSKLDGLDRFVDCDGQNPLNCVSHQRRIRRSNTYNFLLDLSWKLKQSALGVVLER